MIRAAIEMDGHQIQSITARAGVFNQEEVDSVTVMWSEYLSLGPEGSGYYFIVDHREDQVLGFAIYGPRDLTDGVYDLYWIAVDPGARRKSVGRELSPSRHCVCHIIAPQPSHHPALAGAPPSARMDSFVETQVGARPSA